MSRAHDFTQGNTLRHLIRFSRRSSGRTFSDLLPVADSLWVGNLAGARLGAVAVSSVVVFTVLSFVVGMNSAALAILSQQRASREPARVM